MLTARLTQIQRQPAFAKTFQSTFEMAVAVHRLPRHQLHFAAGEALVVSRTHQLAIQPRRGNFQHVGGSRNHVLYVENRAKLTAELRTVLVRHSGRLVKIDPEHPGLAPAVQLDFNHFQAARPCHALGYGAHPFFIKCHESNSLQASGARTHGHKLKSGLAPTGVLRQMLVLHNSIQYINIRPSAAKDKPPRGWHIQSRLLRLTPSTDPRQPPHQTSNSTSSHPRRRTSRGTSPSPISLSLRR